MTHPNFSTGLPCDCGFTRHLSRVSSTIKVADKLHDFLMSPKSRPDLQTPEAQAFLHHLETHYHNDKTDALMPWLTREWKKGRIGSPAPEFPPGTTEPGQPNHGVQPAEAVRPGLRLLGDPNDPEGHWPEHRLYPQTLDHWADFMRSNHPIKRAVGDIMQNDVTQLHNHVTNWDQAMKDEATQKALQGGQVVHTTPDGWTVRQLTTPEELKGEGDAMGHCVGGYGDQVANGSSMIHSLRDPKGVPHATTEISPIQWDPAPERDWSEHLPNVDDLRMRTPEVQAGIRKYVDFMRERERRMAQGDHSMVKVPTDVLQWQSHAHDAERLVNRQFPNRPIPKPHGGQMVQIQGKGNEEPLPEYKARLKDWLGTFSDADRPQWDGPQWNNQGYDEDLSHPSDIEDSDLVPGERLDDYGLRQAKRGADYPSLLAGTLDNGYRNPYDAYDAGHGERVYQLAKARGEIPDLGAAYREFADKQHDSSMDLVDMNNEYLDYPSGADEDSPEMEAYYERERELMDGHPGVQAANHMYEMLAPHAQGDFFTNEVQQPQRQPLAPEEAAALHAPMSPEEQHALQQPEEEWEPQTFAKVAMPMVPTKWDALRQHRDQYVGEFPKFPGDPQQYAISSPEYTAWREQADPEIKAHSERGDEWNRAARNAMATGRMSPEQVADLGYRPMGHETSGNWNEPKWGKWQPLPPQLYHVTSNLPAVEADGQLKSPYELDLDGNGRGLGGGSQDTISLTDSLEEAQNIQRAIREGADVASGRLPIERMVEMARTGEGAQKPWLNAMFGDYDWSKGNPRGLDDLLQGRKPFYRHLLPADHPLQEDKGRAGMDLRTADEWGQHGYYPYPDAPGMEHPEGPLYNGRDVYRQGSPEEKAHEAFEWWRNPWAPMRGWHGGGPSDPMFTSVDPKWFANLDPNHVGIVQATPKPGAHGYPMGSLAEWRIPTGEGIDISHVPSWQSDPQPDQQPPPEPGPPVTSRVILGKPLYKRWVFSPATGKVTLSDNSGDPLDVKYHTDLAADVNEPHLEHGYAYRIDGGWRLTDWDAKPVSDPFVIASVMRALKAAEPRSEAHSASWEASYEEDWSRLHAGLPS